jgi:HlyD family secretion protein
MLRSALWGVLSALLCLFPVAVIVAVCFRLPIPSEGHLDGMDAIRVNGLERIFYAIVFFGLRGGLVLIAVLGALAGILAHSPGTRFGKKSWLTLSLAIAFNLAVVLIFALFANTRESGPATSFHTAVVRRGDLRGIVIAQGTVEPDRLVEIGSQEGGPIEKVLVDYNENVKMGQLLAQIDIAQFRPAVEKAEADLAIAKAGLEQMKAKVDQAENNWQRAQALRPKNDISITDYDSATAQRQEARASRLIAEAVVKQNQSSVDAAKERMARTAIKSPIDGIVLDRRCYPGQVIAPGTNGLFVLAGDLMHVRVVALVDQADVPRIKSDTTVHFAVKANPDESFEGKVTQVRLNAKVQGDSVVYPVIIEAANPDGKLLPFTAAEVRFELGTRQNVVLVSNAALRWSPNAEWVVPDARNAFEQVCEKVRDSGNHRSPEARQCVWVSQGSEVRPIHVETGLTDGAVTEIVNGELTEKMEVIVGQ